MRLGRRRASGFRLRGSRQLRQPAPPCTRLRHGLLEAFQGARRSPHPVAVAASSAPGLPSIRIATTVGGCAFHNRAYRPRRGVAGGGACTVLYSSSRNLCEAAGNRLKNASLIHSLLSFFRVCGPLFDACSASITTTRFASTQASCFCAAATVATRPRVGRSIPDTLLPNADSRRPASGLKLARKSPKPLSPEDGTRQPAVRSLLRPAAQSL